MPGDHHPLAFEGAVDQLRQLVLGLCNAMGAHKSNIAIRWPFCRAWFLILMEIANKWDHA